MWPHLPLFGTHIWPWPIGPWPKWPLNLTLETFTSKSQKRQVWASNCLVPDVGRAICSGLQNAWKLRFRHGELDLWPMTLTFIYDLDTTNVHHHTKSGDPSSNNSWDMNYCPVISVQEFLSSHGQTDRQTDWKRLLRAHRALAQVGSKINNALLVNQTAIAEIQPFNFLHSVSCADLSELKPESPRVSNCTDNTASKNIH